jgi:hypothetical protein
MLCHLNHKFCFGVLAFLFFISCSDKNAPKCDGGILVEGICYPKDCPDRVCPKDFVCRDGECVELKCFDVVCGADEGCVKGVCYPKNCETEPCAGVMEVCVDGVCTDTRCVRVQCPQGRECIEGECKAKDPCLADTACASEHRVCVNQNQTAVCGACVGGYHDEGGVCMEDRTCSANSCSGHGSCDDTSGQVVCTCATGYAGTHCENCTTGYVQWPASGGVCVDDPCDPDPCVSIDHATAGTCVQTGVSSFQCACQAPYHWDVGGCIECNAPSDCDDDNVCTTEECNDHVCGHMNNDGIGCDDNNACTRTDTCQEGVCTGADPVVCVASDQCHDVGICDTGTGVCSNLRKMNGIVCDDNNVCTRTDTCQEGNCTGENPVVCVASDQCHDVGTCDTGTGICSNPTKINGTGCNDGLFCTDPDSCLSGVCGGPPLDCADVDPLTFDTCNEFLGVCEHKLIQTGCPMGDGTFAPKVEYQTGNAPRSVTAGDLNADSIVDLVVANYGSSTVSVFLGIGGEGWGNGTFASGVEYPTGNAPRSVTTGDFNADGILDLAVANEITQNISVLLGNGSGGRGDGTFGSKVDYPASDNATFVMTGDFNSDAILDLAVANGGSNNVSILLGNGIGGQGDGTFAERVDYLAGTNPESLVVGDFNSDEILDLVVSNSNSASVSVLLGNGGGGLGDGTFAPKVDYPAGDSPTQVSTGDFNADRILDLAVVNFSGTISILLGNGGSGRGDGTFGPKLDHSVGAGSFSVTAGDVNADGILDLVTANGNSDNVSILLGNGSSGRGDGTFAPKVDYPVGANPRFVAAGDFNADAVLDLATANYGSDNVSVLLGNGDGGRGLGTFAAKTDYPTGLWSTSVAMGDFNADSILDLAVTNSNSHNISVLLGRGSGGKGDGTFASKVDYPNVGGLSPWFVSTGDFNSDSILDLVTANITSNNVSVFLGNGSGGKGDGTFAAGVLYTTGPDCRSLTTGDFNSDRILDFATGHYGSDKINVLLGNGSGGRGDGTFAAMVSYTTGSNPMSVTTGDFNADGILDLAAASYPSGNISVLLGNGGGGRGDGAFAAKVDYYAGSGAYFLTTGDFNADGILDLVAGSNSGLVVSVLLGNGSGGRGNGTFAAKVDYVAGSSPRGVTTGDFNADKILDLAVSNYDTNNVSVLLGKGNGTFAPRVNYAVLEHPWFVSAGDFNSDGILDMAVAIGGTNGLTGSVVSVLLGMGVCR